MGRVKRQNDRSCGSGKVRYKDHQRAIEALRRVMAKADKGNSPVRVYECYTCKGWHMTSWE